MKILVYTCNIFFVFQRNSTMSSTKCNGVINVKTDLGCCFFVFFMCFLVRKIVTWTVSTAPQYTFPVWKFILRLWICTHCSLCHIRCFGINMPHGRHIYAKSSDMAKATMFTYPQPAHALPHCKCILIFCTEYPYINLPYQ